MRPQIEMPLPMIYQSGNLTIKDYDREMRTYLLDFPNDEVKKGFVTMTANSYLGTRENAGSWVRSAVIALMRGELEKFKTLLMFLLYHIHRKGAELWSPRLLRGNTKICLYL